MRRPRGLSKNALLKQFQNVVLRDSDEGIVLKAIDHKKGRGVFATRNFQTGHVITEITGDLVSKEEGKRREVKYSLGNQSGCFGVFFEFEGAKFFLDSRREVRRLGRIVNHGRPGNTRVIVRKVFEKPHLFIIATEDIQEGDEIVFDYGDRRTKSLKWFPWLRKYTKSNYSLEERNYLKKFTKTLSKRNAPDFQYRCKLCSRWFNSPEIARQHVKNNHKMTYKPVSPRHRLQPKGKPGGNCNSQLDPLLLRSALSVSQDRDMQLVRYYRQLWSLRQPVIPSWGRRTPKPSQIPM